MLWKICMSILSHSVVSDSLQPTRLQPIRILCSWDFSGKNIGVGCHFLLQGIFLTQGSNLCLLHLPHSRQLLYLLIHLGSPGNRWGHSKEENFLSGGGWYLDSDSMWKFCLECRKKLIISEARSWFPRNRFCLNPCKMLKQNTTN